MQPSNTIALVVASLAGLAAACASTREPPSQGERESNATQDVPVSDGAASGGRAVAARTDPVTAHEVERTVASWPERPRLAALQMTARHGPPTVCTEHALVWLAPAPFERITVVREETPHDFPKPHADFLMHTIAYEVPLERVQDVLAFDGSLLIDRTRGELSARCDRASHNVLALNLAHDVARGDKTPDDARRALVDAVVAEFTREPPAIARELAFRPEGARSAFPDEVAIPGAPRRVLGGVGAVEASARSSDPSIGEVLGLLVALDENEVLAALEARQRDDLPRDVADFAAMLRERHGRNLERTMQLARRLGADPLETEDVDRLRREGAALLARVVPRGGGDFARAYVDALIRAHERGLDLIDQRLLPAADAGELREHLTRTRASVAEHLDGARRLAAAL